MSRNFQRSACRNQRLIVNIASRSAQNEEMAGESVISAFKLNSYSETIVKFLKDIYWKRIDNNVSNLRSNNI